MTSEDLRSLSGWRDGEPEDAVDRTWFALDVWSAYDNSVDTLVGVQWGGNLYVTGFADEFDDRYGKILRHAPLPDFAAMARELEELRAENAQMRAEILPRVGQRIVATVSRPVEGVAAGDVGQVVEVSGAHGRLRVAQFSGRHPFVFDPRDPCCGLTWVTP